MSNNVSATFKTRTAAESALMRLEAAGITNKQISLIMTDETRGKTFNMETSNKMPEGATTGAAVGGLIGGVIGALSTATAMAIPGLNIVVAGGIVSTLAGLGAGAASGGLVGGMVGAGIPEHEAKIYEDEIKNGSVLMVIDCKDKEQHDAVEDILDHADSHSLAA